MFVIIPLTRTSRIIARPLDRTHGMVAISPQIAIIAMLLHHLEQQRERERRRVRKHSIARANRDRIAQIRRKESARARMQELNEIPNQKVNELLLRPMQDA